MKRYFIRNTETEKKFCFPDFQKKTNKLRKKINLLTLFLFQSRTNNKFFPPPNFRPPSVNQPLKPGYPQYTAPK